MPFGEMPRLSGDAGSAVIRSQGPGEGVEVRVHGGHGVDGARHADGLARLDRLLRREHDVQDVQRQVAARDVGSTFGDRTDHVEKAEPASDET